MESFLDKVINDINLKEVNLSLTCFILPNKRSSAYFKHKILDKIDRPTFAPTIHSIDSFIIEMSGLSEASLSELLLTLYETYIDVSKKETQTESYEGFISWAPTFIKDISEIEQNLLNIKSILYELIEINKINAWSENKSDQKENHLYWEILPQLYSLFKDRLLKEEKGTKGICYSEAKENLELYKEANNTLQHIFIGLNSLSQSEELIIKELLDFNNGEIYWDIDKEFLRNKSHGAAYFIKKYKNQWQRFSKHPFKWTGQDYLKEKNIQIVGTPKLMGQAKVVGEILSKINHNKPNNTVVVLGDESMINPVLNYLPTGLDDLNITVKPKFYHLEIKNLISEIFDIQLSLNNNREPKIKRLMSSSLVRLGFLDTESLKTMEKQILFSVIEKWDNPKKALNILIQFFKFIILKTKNNSNEFLQIISTNEALEKSKRLLETYSFIKDIRTLKSIITSQLDESISSFKSNLSASVQIMGLLESRAIDFENVIICSVNEGSLPKGKTHSSLIPFDLRKKHGLLTFSDLDSIYTYHFYRLLQKAKNVFLIYNNFNEGVLGGEKSRFIYQIEIEDKHKISSKIYNPIIYSEKNDLELLKSPGSLKRLKELAIKGFSPSSLEVYLKTPEEFYYKNLLQIYEDQEIDKINPRTIGLVFHDSLEALYKPILNKKILKSDLLSLLTELENKVQESFVKNHIKDFKKGKSLIAYEVVKKAIKTLIKNEICDIEQGNEIEIIFLEKRIECELNIKQLKHPVKLKGIIDRVDKRNGVLRIIDYKTGLIKPNEVTVREISSCLEPSHLKAMQLLCYAYMYFKNYPKTTIIKSGLISFRDLNKGFMKFGIKTSSKGLDDSINLVKINQFEEVIKDVILEIMNSKIPFKNT